MSDVIEVKEPICQLKIVSDGTITGTTLTLRDGSPLPFYASKITWTMDAYGEHSGMGRALIEVDFCRFEGTGEIVRMK